MAITLLSFSAGDTDYVARMDTNNSTIATAINNLQAAVAASSGTGAVAFALFLNALFGATSAIIGLSSYGASISSTSVLVVSGSAWKASTQSVVTSGSTVNLSFVGKSAGTYYITIDTAGNPNISASSTDALWSVAWNGTTTLSSLTRLGNVLESSTDETNLLHSTALSANYVSLLSRLETLEAACHSHSII
jgi:hypothetical protein